MMKITTLRYMFKEGIDGLWKNRTMAFASFGTIVLCLMILGISFGLGKNIDYMIGQIENKLGITVYLRDDITKDQQVTLEYTIKAIDGVVDVTYISKEDALKNFSEQNSGGDGLYNAFKDDNPLPASYAVTVNDVTKQEQIVKTLNSYQTEGVDEVLYFQQETNSLASTKHIVNIIFYIILIALIVVGLLLMSNTIRLTVHMRKKEINIMKYVGATDAFIRIPFIIEGVIIGFIGALVSILIVSGGYELVFTKVIDNMNLLNGVQFVNLNEVLTILIPLYVVLGVGIGFIGSGLAVYKHLKV